VALSCKNIHDTNIFVHINKRVISSQRNATFPGNEFNSGEARVQRSRVTFMLCLLYGVLEEGNLKIYEVCFVQVLQEVAIVGAYTNKS
jgi:hypothetical protein